MMAPNDPSESQFLQLTRQLQSFGRVLGINYVDVGHARQNGDFRRSSGDHEGVGAFNNLSDEILESLLRFSISIVPIVKQGEIYAIERQREAKCMKKEVRREKKIMAAQKEYDSALTYIGIYHKQACWLSEEDVARQFTKLTSNTSRVNAVKEQIRIREIGFG